MSTVEVISELVMVETTAIKPYFRNPRRNEKTIAKLVELIPKVGFNVPLVLDHDNVIVKGHARWTAAIQLGMPELPCVYTDADEETIRVDRLTDNRVAEMSEWEEELLKSELTMVDNDAFADLLKGLDFELRDDEPAATPGQQPRSPSPAPAPAEPAPPITAYHEVTCSKCGHSMFIPKASL